MTLIKNETVVKNIIEVNSTSKAIFSALTDKNEITCWFPEQIILEPRLGGHVKFEIPSYLKENMGTFVVEGKIVEFVPNKKISYLCNQIDSIN